MLSFLNTLFRTSIFGFSRPRFGEKASHRICAIAFFSLITVDHPAAAEVFIVAKPLFSTQVLDDGNYTVVGPANANTVSRSTLKDGVVYFSLTVIGRDDAIAYLKQFGRLDVSAVIFIGNERRDSIQIGIDQRKWAQIRQAILSKFDQDGFFTWRTFMTTRQTQDPQVEVQIRDGFSNVVSRTVAQFIP